MSTETQKVNVLEVLDRQIAHTRRFGGSPSFQTMQETRAAVAELIAERDRLDALINSPQTANFLESVRCEVAHQIQRWCTVHDRAKEPQDWFWLVGYLAGKALRAHIDGDTHKALHHTISTAAALANWHAAISLADNRMQPGSSDLQQFLEQTFGATTVARSGGAA